jgi:hypothetical protein
LYCIKYDRYCITGSVLYTASPETPEHQCCHQHYLPLLVTMFKLKVCVNITLLLERISRLGIHLYDVFKQHLIMNPYAFLTASCREFTLLSWSKIRMRKYINSPYLEKLDLARGVQPAFVAQVLIISLCFHSSFTQFCYQPSYCKPYILGQVVPLLVVIYLSP